MIRARRPVRRAPPRANLAAALAGVLLALAALLAPRAALAQLDLSARANAAEVEVGETFAVELKALVEQGAEMPGDPELRTPPEISVVSGPSISTQMQSRFGGGRAIVQLGIGATWQLTASKPGKYVIPAPSVVWQGKRQRANPIHVEVVAATGRPRRPRGSFLLPGGQSFPWPFGGTLADDEPDEGAAAEELAMDAAPEPHTFLRVIADKTTAVVGEQVTVAFYRYSTEFVDMSDIHLPAAPDFLRFPLLKNPGADQPVLTHVGGQRYRATLLDRVALFPIKTGDLHLGPMSMRVTGRRVGSRAQRTSNDVVIRVTEPPRDGRPPGYELGDVGKFNLSAAVQPRDIDEGGSVAVTVKVAGTGNLPQRLRLPERKGLEWLEPEKRESIEPRAGVVAGWRSFAYVVRVTKSGAVDLGTIELPYWSPEERRYVVERAELGTVQARPVMPAAAAPADTSAPRADPWAGLPQPRAALSAYTPPARALPVEGAPFWLLLGAPPLAVIFAGAGERLVRRARARRAAGAASPAKLSAAAQREADEAAARGDAKETATAAERAIHRAIEAATGVRSRGVLLEALAGELEQKGVPRALGDAAQEALAACDAIRFDPGATTAAARDLAAQARRVTDDLGRWKPS